MIMIMGWFELNQFECFLMLRGFFMRRGWNFQGFECVLMLKVFLMLKGFLMLRGFFHDSSGFLMLGLKYPGP